MSILTTPIAGLPTRGWVCEEIADRGEANFRCEWCHSAIIRFVHKLTNEAWFEFIRCGSCCSGKLTDDPVGARVRERAFRLARARRDKWLNADWSRGTDGRLFLNRQGANLSVFPIGDGKFGACVSRESGDWKRWTSKTFPTEAQAKQAALAAIIEALPSKDAIAWSRRPSKAKPKAKAAKRPSGGPQLKLALAK